MNIRLITQLIFTALLASCESNPNPRKELTKKISPEMVVEFKTKFENGRLIFQDNCHTCHFYPDLNEGSCSRNEFDNLQERYPSPWEKYLAEFIQDSKKVKNSGDFYANNLDRAFNIDYEHKFQETLSEQEISDLILYINAGSKIKSNPNWQ